MLSAIKRLLWPQAGLLLFMRHGQTISSDTLPGGGFFAGWMDVPLTPQGRLDAAAGGGAVAALWPHIKFDVAFTSDLQRAHDTLLTALRAMGQSGVPVIRDAAIKERHYGGLTGKPREPFLAELAQRIQQLLTAAPALRGHDDTAIARELSARWLKPICVPDEPAVDAAAAEALAKRVFALWRRSYDAAPPPDAGGFSESLKDTQARAVPYFREVILPRVLRGERVLVSAHGNSFRAMAMALFGVTAQEVQDFTFPLATPIAVRCSRRGRVERVEMIETSERPAPDPKNTQAFQALLTAKGIAWTTLRQPPLTDELLVQRLSDGTGKFAVLGYDGTTARLGWVNVLRELTETPALIERIGQADVPGTAQRLDLLEHIKQHAIAHVVFSGMGGSSSPIAALMALVSQGRIRAVAGAPQLHLLDTTDPTALAQLWRTLLQQHGSAREALERLLFIPISKSGTTAETHSHLRYFAQLYQDTFGADSREAREHLWLMSDAGSRYETLAVTHHHPLLPIQLNHRTDIGGRNTPPGTQVWLLPLALLLGSRRAAADSLQRAARHERAAPLEAVQLGRRLHQLAVQGKNKWFLLLPTPLQPLAPWILQVVEESLGKDGKGATVLARTPEDMREMASLSGDDWVVLHVRQDGSADPYAEAASAWRRLPTQAIMVDRDVVTAAVQLFRLFEQAVAAIGYLWDINFSDQPNVQGYKQLQQQASDDALARYVEQARFTRRTPDGLTLVLDGSPSAANATQCYAEALNGWSPQRTFELSYYGSLRAQPALYETLRTAQHQLEAATRRPGRVLEGPWRNHGAHQKAVGGPSDQWFTLMVAEEHPLPSAGAYDDAELHKGTVATIKDLAQNGRPVVLIIIPRADRRGAELLRQFFTETITSLEALAQNASKL